MMSENIVDTVYCPLCGYEHYTSSELFIKNENGKFVARCLECDHTHSGLTKIQAIERFVKPVFALGGAIRRAFAYATKRNYNKIYIALDLHGVCFPSTYSQGGYTFINDQCRNALQYISNRQDIVIILWSSCYKEEQQEIIKFFADHKIKISYFNENPECENTTSGDFSIKFYNSIIIDDKAGFDPANWIDIHHCFLNYGVLE